MKPLEVAGLLTACDHDGCLADIGGVTAGLDRANLQVLVDAIHQLRTLPAEGRGMLSPVGEVRGAIVKSQWTAIALDLRGQVYIANLRGVAWQVPLEVMHSFVERAAVPFLARGTVHQLLSAAG